MKSALLLALIASIVVLATATTHYKEEFDGMFFFFSVCFLCHSLSYSPFILEYTTLTIIFSLLFTLFSPRVE